LHVQLNGKLNLKVSLKPQKDNLLTIKGIIRFNLSFRQKLFTLAVIKDALICNKLTAVTILSLALIMIPFERQKFHTAVIFGERSCRFGRCLNVKINWREYQTDIL